MHPRKLALLGAGAAVVVSGFGDAKVISVVQQTPTPVFTSLHCYETDDLVGTHEDLRWDNSNFAPTGTGGPVNEQTGLPFDDADLYHEAQATSPLPVCFLGPQRPTRPAAATAERIFRTSGDPPSWQELTT